MFSVLQAGKIEYLQSSIFDGCDFLVHAFCTRRGGASQDEYASLNMSFHEGDEDSSVLQNWGRLAAAFAIPLEQFLVVNQVHKDNIFVINPYGGYFSSRAELDYDAIVTDRVNVAICIKTADCVPVLISDRIKKIIAVVHGGWRGTALGITAKAIRLLQDKYGSTPEHILAAIGPSIGKCCYQVDSVVADSFNKQKGHEHFLLAGTGKNKWMLDLAEANRRQILDGGVPQENIEVSDRCTRCNQDVFFSHRGAGGITGRQINFMIIKGETPCRVLTFDEKNYSLQ